MGFNDLVRSERLLIARRGTDYFAQRLAELTDDQLDDNSLLAGWTRKHLVAHLGYNAVALGRLLDWAVTGTEIPMYESMAHRGQEIDEGATHSAGALRNMFQHSVTQLDEKWQNLPAAAWDAQVRNAQGRAVPASETVWMRTREVWIHAVDLDNGARFDDFPDIVLESLLSDIVGVWRANQLGGDLVIEVIGAAPITVGTAGGQAVRGTLPAVVCWAAGRGAGGLSANGAVPQAPRWL